MHNTVTDATDSRCHDTAEYDALVAAAAAEHGLKLVSRDVRAAGTYRAMGVDLELLP